MTHLLDSNVCISYLRSGGKSHAASRIQAAPPGDIGISAVVREELLFGALRSAKAQKNLNETVTFLSAFPSVPFDDRAADVCSRVRADLEASGTRIGYNDCLIAATALSNGFILVTHNVAEFSRVPGLIIEDWEASP